MATKMFVLLLIFAVLSSHCYSGSISIYWGQNQQEGTLADTCKTGRFDYVIVSFLCVFGNNQTPQLDLDDHCDPSTKGCVGLADDIQSCQSRGVKVLLSIGVGDGVYILVSSEEAKVFADYLWNNYLGGNSTDRPFGDTVLDGIDFDIEGGSPSHYDELAGHLKNYASEKKVYLTAAPQCPFPDVNVGQALSTGLFDYVWMQFYNNYCEYKGNASDVKATFDEWSDGVAATKFFLGLPAAPSSASSGFILQNVLISQILPLIKKANKYGGVMLWSKYYDDLTGYSSSVKSYV